MLSLVNLLLCLICTLNFIIGMGIWKKNSLEGLVLSVVLGIHEGTLNVSSVDKGGQMC